MSMVMNKIIDYTVLTLPTHMELMRDVRILLKGGWQPLGGVSVLQGTHVSLSQALVKYEDNIAVLPDDVENYLQETMGKQPVVDVSIMTMKMSDNREEYYTRITCDGRTFDVRKYNQNFRNRADYEVAELRHVLLGEVKPDLMAPQYADPELPKPVQVDGFDEWLDEERGPIPQSWTPRKAIEHLLEGLDKKFHHHFWKWLRSAHHKGHIAGQAQPLNQGWVIGDGGGKHWRAWQNGLPKWTSDRALATRYHRREDAEAAHLEDDDAWVVVPYEVAVKSAIEVK